MSFSALNQLLATANRMLTLLFRLSKRNLWSAITRVLQKKANNPINISVKEHVTTVNTTLDFAMSFQDTFNEKVRKTLINANENDLILTSKGIRIGNGEIWFNQYCTDADCTEGEFLITQINN
jgi:hypothetical protein